MVMSPIELIVGSNITLQFLMLYNAVTSQIQIVKVKIEPISYFLTVVKNSTYFKVHAHTHIPGVWKCYIFILSIIHVQLYSIHAVITTGYITYAG